MLFVEASLLSGAYSLRYSAVLKVLESVPNQNCEEYSGGSNFTLNLIVEELRQRILKKRPTQ